MLEFSVSASLFFAGEQEYILKTKTKSMSNNIVFFIISTAFLILL